MTTKTTNSEKSGTASEPVIGRSGSSTGASAGRGVIDGGPVGGTSTGAPAAPTAAASSNYNRERSSYNPATGSGFSTANQQRDSAGRDQRDTTSGGTASDGGTSQGPGASTASGSKGERRDSGFKRTMAGIHGAGESLRGTVGAAIDRAFNDQEGVAKNQAVAREGEWEVKTGQFADSTKRREGFNTQRGK